MYSNFKKNIDARFDIKKDDRILLATSGGADSVVMLDLFSRAKYICGIAHCNFHLRGEDSNRDEKFVNELANQYNFRYHNIEFNTKEHSAKYGISIEMAARDLRYEWFEKIRQTFDYKYIAVAHHKDDIIETFFINLVRGTGIRGLSGIKWKNGTIIRPLLFANRQEIMSYTAANNLKYREDKTNKDTTIIRNKLRHEILPLFKDINLAANENILKTINNLYSSELIINQNINDLKKRFQSFDKEMVIVDIEGLQELDTNKVLLYEFLREYKFNSSQVQGIYKALSGESGRLFLSETHQLVKDRKSLVISKINDDKFCVLINENDNKIELPNSQILNISLKKIDNNYKIPTQINKIALDYDKVVFPLKIRNWCSGDYFYPFGMIHKKKLSDFFINEKYSITDKQNALLLLSDNKIVWIIGKRLDNRFKITSKTKKVIEVSVNQVVS